MKCSGADATAATETPQPLRRGLVASSCGEQTLNLQGTSQTPPRACQQPPAETPVEQELACSGGRQCFGSRSPYQLCQSQIVSPFGSRRFCFSERSSQQRFSAESSTRPHSIERSRVRNESSDTFTASCVRFRIAESVCVGSTPANETCDGTLQQAHELREQRFGQVRARHTRSPTSATVAGLQVSPRVRTARPGSRQGSVRRHSVHHNTASFNCYSRSPVCAPEKGRISRGDDEDVRTERLTNGSGIVASCSSPIVATPAPRKCKTVSSSTSLGGGGTHPASSSTSLGGGGAHPHSVGSAYIPSSSATQICVPLSAVPLNFASCASEGSVVAEVAPASQLDVETEIDLCSSVAKMLTVSGGKHDTKPSSRNSVNSEELIETCQQLETQLAEQVKKNRELRVELKEERTGHAATQGRLGETKQRLNKHDVELPQMEARVLEQESRLVDRLACVRARTEQLASDEEAMQVRERDLSSKEQDILRREGELVAAERQLAERERRLAEREERLANREGKVAEQANALRVEREQAAEEIDRLTAELKRDKDALQTAQDQCQARQKQLDEREQHHFEACREALVLKSRSHRCSGKENLYLERQRDDQQRLMKMIKSQGWQKDSKMSEEILVPSANSP